MYPKAIAQAKYLERRDAVTIQPTKLAGNKNKNSLNVPFPAVQTINVVISPKGDHAPPSLAIDSA